MSKSKPKEYNNSTDIYDNDIEYYFLEYCQKYNFNPFKITYRQWTGGLMYIYNHTFKQDNSKLFEYNNLNQKQYNLYVIDKLVDLYIYMCNVYSKEVSVYGFCTLSGIQDCIIYSWKNSKYRYIEYYSLSGEKLDIKDIRGLDESQYVKRASYKAMNIYIKLTSSTKQSIRDGAGSVGVGPLALFNDMIAKESIIDSRAGQIQDYSKTDIINRLGIETELQSLPDLQTENR